MEIANTILIIVGIIVVIIGIATFINPNFSRIINALGGPRLKAVIALITVLYYTFNYWFNYSTSYLGNCLRIQPFNK